MTRRQRGLLAGGATVLAVSVLLAWIATGTVVTRQAVGPRLSTRPLPRYVKALDFLHRHYQFQMLARDITRADNSGAERAVSVFTWTRENIRRAPDDWPVVDDHTLNVIIRGYGVPYQMADVFATLSTYAGVPAFWQTAAPRGSPRAVPLSFALIQGKWAVFDVAEGTIFSGGRGDFADARDVVPGLELPPPRPLRAELQMPWPRALHETRRRVGW